MFIHVSEDRTALKLNTPSLTALRFGLGRAAFVSLNEALNFTTTSRCTRRPEMSASYQAELLGSPNIGKPRHTPARSRCFSSWKRLPARAKRHLPATAEMRVKPKLCWLTRLVTTTIVRIVHGLFLKQYLKLYISEHYHWGYVLPR